MRKGLAALALVALLARGVSAAEEARLAKAKDLYAQAEPFANRSDDPDAEPADRKAARAEALRLLKDARSEFQAWQAANGEDADDPIGPEIGKLLYWMKKMSGVADAAPSRAPDSAPAPSPGPRQEPQPGPSPAPGATPPPPVPAPPPDPAAVARADFAALEARATEFRDDPSALRNLYEQFLADHPDPALPEYARAAERLGKLQEELNATFKRVVRTDPDAVEGVDTRATPAVMARLKRELSGKDPDGRRNAARLLGLTRSGAASFALVLVLRDPDAELAALARDGLIAIGGSRTAENLAKQFRNSTPDAQTDALAVLEGIARKGSVDARTVSPVIGRFALSNDGPVAKRALDFLGTLGADGGPGLCVASETRIPDKRLAVIEAIGKSRWMPGALRLAELLNDYGPVPGNPALAALKEMGTGTTPYLSRALGAGGKTRQYAAWALREVTGQQFGMQDARAWQKWWEETGSKSPR